MDQVIMTALAGCKIIDISQPISSKTACFPGDVPFSRQVTVAYDESQFVNLTALTMSPHVGTHADAPNHIRGKLEDYEPHSYHAVQAVQTPQTPQTPRTSPAFDASGALQSVALDAVETDPVELSFRACGQPGNTASEAARHQSIGWLPLGPYIGPATVIDLAPCSSGITADAVATFLESGGQLNERVLFKTQQRQDCHQFQSDYSFFLPELIEQLASAGVKLVGIDTPSVDRISAQQLVAHHRLADRHMSWLENLDLSMVAGGQYFLIALPLKFMELEASPVRAILLA